MTIAIPPLRERDGDTIAIATCLLQRFSNLHNKRISKFSKEAAQAIEAYPWPGNIRELENKIKRAVIMAPGTTIELADLEMAPPMDDAMPLNLQEVRENAETAAIKRALQYANNNISAAAKLLGVTRPTLYTLINKYAIGIDQ